MKKTVLIVGVLLGIIINTQAQQKAITEMGQEVILYDDGTWVYQDKEEAELKEIPLNEKSFEKAEKATFQLKSKNLNVGVWINPKVWSFQNATENPDAEYEFQLRGEDLYAMLISEKVEIPLDALRKIAIDNGRSVAPDLKVVKEEYRMVNGIKVLLLEMHGTMQGIKFAYYGYYYSNERGTVQLITYTSQNLLKTYRKECNAFLNGLVAL